MRYLSAVILALMPLPALACGNAVCLVDPDSLVLPEIITFNETRSGYGPGYAVDDVLALKGAKVRGAVCRPDPFHHRRK